MIKLVFNNMAVNILFLSTFDIDRIILIFEIWFLDGIEL